MPLLLHGRKIAADLTKSGSASRAAKGASNLLLHFDHAQIAFCQIVGERNAQVIERRQYLFGTAKQGIEQILGPALLAPPPPRSGGGGWGRLSGIASRQDFEIASDPFVPLDGRNRRVAPLAPLVTRLMQR